MKFRLLALICILGGALAVTGISCGGDDDDDTTTPTGTNTGTNTGSGGSGTGGTSSGGTSAGGGTTTKGGFLFAFSGEMFFSTGGYGGGVPVGMSTVEANFGEQVGVMGLPTDCTSTTHGDCTRLVCPSDMMGGSGGAGTGGGTVMPHAGVITITGGSQSPVTLTPDTMGQYSSDLTDTAKFFDAGAALTWAAAGDTVPQFSHAITAPSSVEITAPTFAMGQVTVNTAQDLSVVWNGGTAGNVNVTFGGENSTAKTMTMVFCTYTATTGSGTVPSAAMAGLASADAEKFIMMGGGAQETFNAGDYNITLQLVTIGTVPGGIMAAGQATYQ